jgi:hypothetical protein
VTRDLDTLLRDADPLRDRPADDDTVLLRTVRERVDRERTGTVPASRRPRWGRRVALVAAAAAVLTAVPLVISAVSGDDDGHPRLLQAAVAATGEINCGSGYTTAVPPGKSPVRLLPDRLPAGWSYTNIMVRSDDTAGCVPPSLTALREDATGLVTGRISVTGPVDARIDQGKIVARTAADTVFGHAARRFDLRRDVGDGQVDYESHRWVWTDEQGRQWSVEASGMPLDEARQELAAVSISGSDVAWNGTAAPGWTLEHLRTGPPYSIGGELTWWVELTDGSARRFFQVWVRDVQLPLLAMTGVGETVTTVGGRPAVLSQVRVNTASPGTETDTPPGSVTRPVLVEIVPGTTAFGVAMGDDLPKVEQMLASLRQVSPTDPRLEKYGTD